MALKERQLQVDKPRLRKKRRRADEPGEVEIPAYTALQADQRLADRMLELVLRGVSTRKYETVLPAMADQVGVSKSEVSRETIEAGTRVLKELVERDLSELDPLPHQRAVESLRERAGARGRESRRWLLPREAVFETQQRDSRGRRRTWTIAGIRCWTGVRLPPPPP